MAKVKAYYFSPTGGTLEVLRNFAEPLGRLLLAEVEYHSYTLPKEREELPQFYKDDVVVWATPVYAGRIPTRPSTMCVRPSMPMGTRPSRL